MEKILEVNNLKKTYYKEGVPFTAVDDVSFYVKKGECLGIVGESGCGKTTTARMITLLEQADSGSVLLNGEEILNTKRKNLKKIYKNMQMVFQSPQDSFDPRCTIGDGIMESMINHGISGNKAKQRMEELLNMVELSPEAGKRYPHEVSGGQCQRAAIARALAVSPNLIICDEATSALDVTVQAQIICLLKKLKEDMGLSLLLICHDLALVQNFCDRAVVMYQGRIIETGTPDEIICNPVEEYTKVLIDSVL